METIKKNSELPSDMNPGENSKKTRNILMVAVALLLGGIGYFIFQNASLNDERDQLNKELVDTSSELQSISTELESKIQEIQELGGDIEELEKVKEEILAEKEKLQKASRSQLAGLKRKLKGFKLLLESKDEEITKLKEVNEELLSQNTGLKEEKNLLNQKIDSIKTQGEKLQSKVKQASQLKVQNIEVLSINKRGKERAGTLRGRQIENIKIKFKYSDNEVAPVKGIESMIRILDPNGQVLFDVAKGAGTLMINGQETFYTLKKELLFDNSNQEVVFEYNQLEEYAAGKYTVEILTDDYLSGVKTFEIK